MRIKRKNCAVVVNNLRRSLPSQQRNFYGCFRCSHFPIRAGHCISLAYPQQKNQQQRTRQQVLIKTCAH